MTTQTAQGQGFDTELKTTELGEFLLKNKGLIISFILVLIVGVISFGVYKNVQAKKENSAAAAFYNFESTRLKEFSEGKIDAASVATEFSALKKEQGSKSAAFVSSLYVADVLLEKGNAKEALVALEGIQAENIYQKSLLGMKKAAILEEAGNVDEAITLLESMKSNELKVIQGKLYLDLGRLYMNKGNKDLAKQSFEFVHTLTTQQVFKAMASYYLEQL